MKDEQKAMALKDKRTQLSEFLGKPGMMQQLDLAARGTGLDTRRAIRLLMTECSRNPRLYECSLESTAGTLIQSTQLGLEFSHTLGHAYPVPFYNTKRSCYEMELVVGYKGLVKLSRQGGEVSGVHASVVHEKDEFSYQYGTDSHLHHKPYMGPEDPGEVICSYAVARLTTDGTMSFVVVPRRELDKLKDAAVKKTKGYTPWATDEEAMQMKSAVRRLAKLLPVSPALQRAATLDELNESGVGQDNASLVDAIDIDAASTLVDDDEGDPEKPVDEAPAEEKPKPEKPKAAAAKDDAKKTADELRDEIMAFAEKHDGQFSGGEWDEIIKSVGSTDGNIHTMSQKQLAMALKLLHETVKKAAA